MADVQKQFEKFHDTIRVDYDMAQDLRDPRDAVVERITKYLQDNKLPGMSVLHQGSYKLKTGVKPIGDLEYDIDVGIRFGIRPEDYPSSTVRKWVYDSVKDHTQRIEDKGPCVRVAYKKGYHIDLVTYSVWEGSSREIYKLAHKTKGWRPSDPPGLVQYVDAYRESNFKDTEDFATKTDQFRRCIRYLRRWNDERFPSDTDSKPTGLGLVVLVIQRAIAVARFVDGRSDDLSCLHAVSDRIASTPGRIEVKKPSPEHEDLFGRIGDKEMEVLKQYFRKLTDALQEARVTFDPVNACKRLQEVFGSDFPVPDPEDTAKKTRAPAIISSSSSA